MKKEIQRDEAWLILNKYIKKQELIFHARESEEIMKALAKYLKENETFWGICGLLHDIDYQEIGDNLKNHGPRSIEILRQEGFDLPEMFQAILSHVEFTGHLPQKRTSKLDFALSASENISGFIVAVALMRPEKFKGLKTKSIKKKLKDKRFAAKVNREAIYDIEKINLSLDKFIELAIEAVSSLQKEIGF